MERKIEFARLARKRVLSATGEPASRPKPCRLSMEAGRSPLRPIQQARHRHKAAPVRPALTAKRAQLESCADPRWAAADRVRTAAAARPTATATAAPKPSLGQEARTNRKRTEKSERNGVVDRVPHRASGRSVKNSNVDRPSEIAEDEYAEDILSLLLVEEERQRLAPDFLATQHAVTPADRAVIVDWLILVQHYLRLDGGTLHLAVCLMDRVLASFSCPLDDLQLLGIAALWVSAKMEETRLPSARELLRLAEDGYTLASLLDMELLVLHVTEFRLVRVHPAPLLSLLLHRLGLLTSRQTRYAQACQYLLDLGSCRLGGVYRLPSVTAAGTIYATELLFAEDDARWILRKSGIPASKEIVSVAALILVELSNSHKSSLQGARKKYSSQSRYQNLSSCAELSPEHAHHVLRRLARPSAAVPDPSTPGADLAELELPAELSQEF